MVNRRVEFRVNNHGEVRTEFTGFGGSECYEESERLRRLLAALGVDMEDREITPKTGVEMALEAGLDLDEGDPGATGAKVKRGGK